MSAPGMRFVGLSKIDQDNIPAGAVICRARSFASAMIDLEDIFKPHKYGWPAPLKDIEKNLREALKRKRPGIRFFAVFGLARSV